MNNDREKKILLMKIGAISIVVLIFILWIFNIKNVWRPINENNGVENGPNIDLLKFKEDINKQMTEINQRLSDISNKKQEAKDKASDELLGNLIKEVNKASSSLISTSTPGNVTSTPILPTINNKNCPPYINCMPTIGVSRPCQIPVGCEEITIIAY
jgi:hypothetical protein